MLYDFIMIITNILWNICKISWRWLSKNLFPGRFKPIISSSLTYLYLAMGFKSSSYKVEKLSNTIYTYICVYIYAEVFHILCVDSSNPHK